MNKSLIDLLICSFSNSLPTQRLCKFRLVNRYFACFVVVVEIYMANVVLAIRNVGAPSEPVVIAIPVRLNYQTVRQCNTLQRISKRGRFKVTSLLITRQRNWSARLIYALVERVFLTSCAISRSSFSWSNSCCAVCGL